MSSKTVADNQSKILQKKLNSAIAARALLEKDSKAQSSMLIEFINKLSQVSKGIDIKLDNRLAQLRVLFTKSAPLSEIESKISEIVKLLQQISVTNKVNITQVHTKFNDAGNLLRKVKGLPLDVRKNLRDLLAETHSTQDNLAHYTPLLSQLLEFYKFALSSKSMSVNEQPLESNQPPTKISDITRDTIIVNSKLIEKISSSLSKIELSTIHTNQLFEINRKLLKVTNNDEVLQSFVEIFDLIYADLQSERDSANTFLTSLRDTLTSVQDAVKTTLSTCKETQNSSDKINKTLQEQLLDVSGSVKGALSLEIIKTDIKSKINNITDTLTIKAKIEQESQQALAEQLMTMAEKVEKLEGKSLEFEKKLAEQQRKSMEDALTKLSNRAAFDEYFTKIMVRFHHKSFDLALAVMDIDDFKYINDTYGHTAGDKTLQVIANTIRKKVSAEVFVARYGGEEFVLIAKNQKKEQLVETLKIINQDVARLPFKFKDHKVSITLSIGATHILQEDNIHTAFERADEAMYLAKSQGKNQVIYF